MAYGQPFWTRNIKGKIYDSLTADATADVAVVGAGFTGLSAAYHLKNRGYKVALIDAGLIGESAGRAGGLINPSSEEDAIEMVKGYGTETANEEWQTGHKQVQNVLDMGPAERTGSIYLGTPDDAEYLREEAEQRVKFGSSATFTEKPSISMAGYPVGVVDESDYTLDPAAYTRSVAEELAIDGVRIFENTKITDTNEDGVVSTNGTRVRAGKVVLALQNVPTNSRLTRYIVPFETYCLMTEPLTQTQIERVNPDRRQFWNTSTDYRYGRMAGDRLLFGGNYIHEKLARLMPDRRPTQLKRDLFELFPELDGVGIEYSWGGTCYGTYDEIPMIDRDGNTIIIGGTTGIPHAVTAGKVAAEMLDGETENPFEPRTMSEMLLPKFKNMGFTWTEIKALAGF